MDLTSRLLPNKMQVDLTWIKMHLEQTDAIHILKIFPTHPHPTALPITTNMCTYLAWKHNTLITDHKHILEEKGCYGKFAWRNKPLSLWISYRLYYHLRTKSFCLLILTQASLLPLFLPARGGLYTHENNIKLRSSLIETDATDEKHQSVTWAENKVIAMDSITRQQNNARGKKFYSTRNRFTKLITSLCKCEFQPRYPVFQ